MMACDFVCHNVTSFSCAMAKWIQRRRLARVSTQCCSALFLVSTCHLGIFFFNLISQGSWWVKNTVCRPSRFFPPVMSPASKIDFKLNEHPRRTKKKKIRLKGIATWPINSGSIKFPPVCPWKARIYNKVLQEFWQYWNGVLLLPFQIWLIQSLSEEVSPPCFRNASFSFRLLHLLLSWWFSWRTNLQTKFEIWYPNSYLWQYSLAVMSSQFLSFIGMKSTGELLWGLGWTVGCSTSVSSMLP